LRPQGLATREPCGLNEATYNEATYNEATYNEATYNEATYNEATYNEATYNRPPTTGVCRARRRRRIRFAGPVR